MSCSGSRGREVPGAYPLSAVSMETSSSPHPSLLSTMSSFLHHHLSRLSADLCTRLADARRNALAAACSSVAASAPFATVSTVQHGRHAFDLALSADYVAQTLAGTSVYTVGNANNEFVLVSDPNNGAKSLGVLCFREEDAQALLAQVQLRQPVLGRGARVVPIKLDQVYMLKVEGIAFRFLPDPLQIKHALQLRSADRSGGFVGVPVFQSDLLVVKKKNRRYCPIYFQKEDIERELLKSTRGSKGDEFSHQIMVGSLEDVLKKMEINEKNYGWEDLIFIPPGKSCTEHINEVAA